MWSFPLAMGNYYYILGTNDRHWTPVYLQCNLCHTTFQFILTLETLQQDEAAMFSYFNISNKLHHRTSNRWNEKKEIFQNKIFFRNPIQINKVVRKNCGNKTKYIFVLFIGFATGILQNSQSDWSTSAANHLSRGFQSLWIQTFLHI